MVEWKRAAAILIILSCFGVPIIWAAYTASFSDSVWQVPTMKADQFYVGDLTLAEYITEVAPGGTGGSSSNVTAATYIIYEDGSTYYARSGLNGATTSNANFAALINSLVTTNTMFFLKSDTYTLDDPITIDYDGVSFIGESRGTGAIIDCSTSDAYFSLVDAGASDLDYTTFKNLYFDGSTASLYAINSSGQGSDDSTRFVLIEDCTFRYWVATNYKVVYIQNPELTRIINCHFATWTTTANTGGTFIYFDEEGYDSGNVVIENNEFYTQMTSSYGVQIVGASGVTFESLVSRGNHFYATGTAQDGSYAYKMTLTGRVGGFRSVADRTEGMNYLTETGTSTSYGWVITGGEFDNHSNSTYPGINISGTGCRGTTIIGNYFMGGPDQLVILDDNSDSNNPTVITNNQFRVTSGTPTLIDDNAATVIRENTGYITENTGTGTITTTSVVITHGLSYTPTAQDITITFKENPTDAVGSCWVDTITSTEFTVNVEGDPGTSNLDFGWAVRKGP